MSERLGHLVYWIACLIAAVALCVAVYAAVEGGLTNDWLAIGLLAGGGVLTWMLGRAIRNALAPPTGPAERPRQGHDG